MLLLPCEWGEQRCVLELFFLSLFSEQEGDWLSLALMTTTFASSLGLRLLRMLIAAARARCNQYHRGG